MKQNTQPGHSNGEREKKKVVVMATVGNQKTFNDSPDQKGLEKTKSPYSFSLLDIEYYYCGSCI